MNINLKSLNILKALRNKKMWYLIALLFLWWGQLVVHPIYVAEQTEQHDSSLRTPPKAQGQMIPHHWPSQERVCARHRRAWNSPQPREMLHWKIFLTICILNTENFKSCFFVTFQCLNTTIKFQRSTLAWNQAWLQYESAKIHLYSSLKFTGKENN